MSIKQLKNNKPELLAPAGSLEAFFAAMENGADAVYAGLKEFSARAKAKNFTLSQLERMLAYAHERGRKVYVTLNTLVKEAELPQLVDTLAALEGMAIDAVIIQDLAIARLARLYFPGIPLHASTQMTIHNVPGVQQLADLGFQRAVLARELHLDEIRTIVQASPIGIECFIHGALCFSYSGQCYFSSFLGGHSGNRGRCAQPCRRQYRNKGKEGYYFSTNDFSSIDLVPQMVAAGIESFKIEGRMKSAEYVASVVGAYRMALDATPSTWPTALAAAKEQLKLSFGRVPTKGFLASNNPTDIATPSLRGATGRFLGEIKSIRGDRICFESKDRLHVGDRLRVQPKSDLAGKAFTIKQLFLGPRPVKSTQEKAQVAVPSPFACSVGDAVFKVSSETAFTMSEVACLKKLEAVGPAKIPCDLTMALTAGKLVVTAGAASISCTLDFPLGDLETSRTSDMTGVLTGQFNRTGDTPFTLRSLAAPDFPAVLIPAARLKEIRREFYQLLSAQVLPTLKSERRQRREAALAALVPKHAVRPARGGELIVRVEHLRDLSLLHQDGIHALSFPVSKANLHELPPSSRRFKGREEQILWRLPFIISDAELPWYREALATLFSFGFRRFEAANLSHFPLLRETGTGLVSMPAHGQPTPVEITTDYRLFSLNSQALLAWQELGVTVATLYIEDDAANLAELLAADVCLPRRIIVYAGVPAITSKITIKGVKSDTPLLSDRGDGYLVTAKDGLTVVTPTRKFSLTAHRDQLLAMGCTSYVIDLAGTPKEQWPLVLDAFRYGRPLENTSEFNFVMGLT